MSRANNKNILIVDNTLSEKIVDTTTRTDGSAIYWDAGDDMYKHSPIDPATGVPYSGATMDVDLGNHSITTESVVFNNTPTVTPIDRELYWDVNNDTLAVKIPDGGIIQINQEPFDYYTNKQGSPIVNGDIVSIFGATGTKTTVKLSDATVDSLAMRTIGMVTVATIADNATGRVTKSGGKVRELNTNAFNEGDILYVDPLNPGKWTSTKPNAPYRAIRIGVVDVKSATVGVVDLSIHVEAKLTELADVNGTPLATLGQIPVWHPLTSVFDFDYNVLHLPTQKIGGVADYTEFEADGTMKMVGDATVWDDIYPSSVDTGVGGAAPSFTAYNGNLRAYEFVGVTTTKELHIGFQLPHSYKEGTNIRPHIHLYIPNDVTGGDIFFQFEYTWANIDSTGAITPLTIDGTLTRTAGAGIANNAMIMFPAITGTGKTISSILMCRLVRNPTSGSDTFASSVWLKSADIHIECDSIGSRTVSSK